MEKWRKFVRKNRNGNFQISVFYRIDKFLLVGTLAQFFLVVNWSFSHGTVKNGYLLLGREFNTEKRYNGTFFDKMNT